MTRLLVRIAVTAAMMGTGIVPAATLSVWSVDPHLKVFRDAVPAGKPAVAISMRAARNEFEPAQIALRSDAPLRAVRVETTPLRAADGSYMIDGAILEQYARNMAAHCQNVVITPWTLVRVDRELDRSLSFDFSRFDRYVELFERAGAAERIEIGHIGHGQGGWGKPVALDQVRAHDRVTGEAVALEPGAGLAPLLHALEGHLAGRGWLERALIHVADEPILDNLDSWRQASNFLHRHAPLLLVETEPPAGATLYQGPMPIEVRGITEPGATVKINARTCQIGGDGTFVFRPGPGREGDLRIEAEKDGRTKTVVKSFLARK